MPSLDAWPRTARRNFCKRRAMPFGPSRAVARHSEKVQSVKAVHVEVLPHAKAAYASAAGKTGDRNARSHLLSHGGKPARAHSGAARARLDGAHRPAIRLSLHPALDRQCVGLGGHPALLLLGDLGRRQSHFRHPHPAARRSCPGHTPGRLPFRPWHPDLPHRLSVSHQPRLGTVVPRRAEHGQTRHRCRSTVSSKRIGCPSPSR